ncbi:ferredoxin, 2Fe-2S [Burkholderia sp. D7]|nr:ferredoxin, 2Fe-2S [Burkholderia sp. D7]
MIYVRGAVFFDTAEKVEHYKEFGEAKIMLKDTKEMSAIIVTTRDGIEHEIEGRLGVSVMESLRDGGIDQMMALCGGCCSCATCHIYIDEAFINLLPPPSQDENELLESSAHRRGNSRLSCQIKLSENLAGLRIVISPED